MKGRLWLSILLILTFTLGKINISHAQGITPCNFNGTPVACPSGVPDGAVGSAGGMAPFAFVAFSQGIMTFPVSNYTPMAFMAAMSSMVTQAMDSMMGPNTAQSQANVTNSVTGSLNQQPNIPNPTQNLFTVFSEVPADKRVVLASATNTLLTDLDHEFRGNGEPIADTPTTEDSAKEERLARLNRNRDLFGEALFGEANRKGLLGGENSHDHQASDSDDGNENETKDLIDRNALGLPLDLQLEFGKKDKQQTKEINPFNKFVRDTLTGKDGVFRGITELFQAAKKGIRFLARESIEEELEEDIEDLKLSFERDKGSLSRDKDRLQGRIDDLREARQAVSDAQGPGNKLIAKQKLGEAQDAVNEARKNVDASQERVDARQDKLDLANKQLEAFDKQVAEQELKERQKSSNPFSFKPGFLGISKQPKEEEPFSEPFQLNPKLGLEFPSKRKNKSDSFVPGGQVEQNVPGTGDGTSDFQQAKVDLLGGDDEGFTVPDKTQGSIADKLEPLRLQSLKQSDRAQAAFDRVLETQANLDEARVTQSGLALDVERAKQEQQAIKREPSSTAKTLRLRNANQAVRDAQDALDEANQEVKGIEKELNVLRDIAAKELAVAKGASDAYFTASVIESGKIVLKSLGVDPEQNSPSPKAGPTETERIHFQRDATRDNKWLKRARDLWDDSFGIILGKGPPKPITPPPFDPSFFEPPPKAALPGPTSTSAPPATVEQSVDGTLAGPGTGFEQLGAGAGDFVAESADQSQTSEQPLTPEQQEKIKGLQIMEKKLALAWAEGDFEGESPDQKIKEIRDALDILQGKPFIARLGIFEKGRRQGLSKQEQVQQENDFVEVPSDFAKDVGVDFGESQGGKASKKNTPDTPQKTEVAKENFQEVPQDFFKDIGVDIEKGLTTTPSSGKKPNEFIDKGSFDQTGVDFLGPGSGQDLLADDGGGFVADDSGGKNRETGKDSSKGQSGQSFADRRFQEVQNQLDAKRKKITDAKGELAEAEKDLINIQKNSNAPANRLARPGAEQAVKDAQAKVDGLKEGIEQLQQQSTKFAKSADSAQKSTDRRAGLKGQISEPNDDVQKLIDRAVQGDKEAMKALGGKVGGSSGDDLQKLLDVANDGDGKAQDEIYFELLNKANSGDNDAQELLRYLEGLAILGGAETGKTLAEQLRTQQRDVRKRDREIRKLEGQQKQAEQDLDQRKKGRREASAALGKGDSSKFEENLKKFNDLGKEVSKQKTKLDGINDKLQEAKETRDVEARKAVELMQSIRAVNQRDVQDKRETKKRNSSSSDSSDAPSFNKVQDVEQGFFDFGSETVTENLAAGGDGFQAPDPGGAPTQLIEDIKAEIEAREQDLREFPGLDLRGMAEQAAQKAADALENASFFQWSTFKTTAQQVAEKELRKLLEDTPTAFQSETPDERRDRLRREFPDETDDQIEARAVEEEQEIEKNLESKDKDGQEVIGEEIMIDKVAKAKLARNIAIDIGQAAGTAFSRGTREDLERAAESAVDEELQNQEELEMLQNRVDSKGLEALEQKLVELQNTQAQDSSQGDQQRAEGSSTDSDSADQGQGDNTSLGGNDTRSPIFKDVQAQDVQNAAPVMPISFSNTGSNQSLSRKGGVSTPSTNRPLVLNSVP